MRTLTAFLVAISSAALFAQDGRARLEWARSTGDTATVKVSSEIALDLTSEDAAGKKTRDVSQREEAEYRQTVRKAEGGAATSLRIQCVKSRRQIGVKEEPTVLDGRSFLVTAGGGVGSEDGGSVPTEAQALGGWEQAACLLSSADVSVGDRWSVDPSGMGKVVSVAGLHASKGECGVILNSLDGGRATLALTASLEGKTDDGFTATLKLDGHLVMDTARKAPVSLELSGTLEMDRRVTEKRREGLVETEVVVGKVHARSRVLKVSVSFE